MLNRKKRDLLAKLKQAVKIVDEVTKTANKEGLDDGKLMGIADSLEIFITDEMRDEYGLRASQEYEDL